MITIAEGLKNSFKILKMVKQDKKLKKVDIYVRCFMNGRECGLTFTHWNSEMTYCVYEHRNSDEIIINSKKNWTSFSEDLPYKGDSKYVYDSAFKYNEYKKCFNWLKKRFLELEKKGK